MGHAVFEDDGDGGDNGDAVDEAGTAEVEVLKTERASGELG